MTQSAPQPARFAAPIGLAVIGCGMMGSIRSRIAARHSGVREIHLFDIDTAKAESLAAEIDGRVCSSAAAAIHAEGVGGVIVSTRPANHHELARLAIDAGLPVFVEKPFTRDADSAEDLVRTAASRNVPIFAGYTQRFRHNYLGAKHQVSLGQLGQVTGGLITFYTTRTRAESRLRKEPTGSPTANNFPHAADLALWFLEGARPVRITAVTSRGPLAEHRDVALTAWCLLQFDTGAVVTIGTSWELPKRYPAYHATMGVDLFGTAGVIRIDDSHSDVFMSSDDRIRTIDAPDMPPLDLNQVFMGTFPPGAHAFGQLWGPAKEETEAFIQCAMERASSHPIMPSGADGLAVRRIVDAAAQSLQLGEPLDL